MARDMNKLRGLTAVELGEEERALREEMWKLRLARATGQAAAPRAIVKTRRALARLLTIRRENELATAKE